MVYVFIPIMLAVATGLAWTWWQGRADRDPAGSVDQFSRALTAMGPLDDRDGPA